MFKFEFQLKLWFSSIVWLNVVGLWSLGVCTNRADGTDFNSEGKGLVVVSIAGLFSPQNVTMNIVYTLMMVVITFTKNLH